MAQYKIDANKVIDRLNTKLADALLQNILLELRIEELEAQYDAPKQQQVYEGEILNEGQKEPDVVS